jgi:tryptophan halogenase
MHICIVGTGASGWLAAHFISKNEIVDKVTIVGSDKIPPIGVGESTTLNFRSFMKDTFDFDFNNPTEEYYKFLVDVDAAIKTGVYYQNWSSKDFLHAFYPVSKNYIDNCFALGNKPIIDSVDDYTVTSARHSFNNKIEYFTHPTDEFSSKASPHTIHFDAAKFISTMERLAKSNKKLNHTTGTAVDLLYDGDVATTLVLDDGRTIEADYFVSCIGQTAFNQKVFKEEYESLSDVLLTNKAVVYPLEYEDKPKQFHPHTVAKTMKAGWRWITPTWSRIGTGYVFSTNHISEEQAVQEFKDDIGRQDIQPFTVDFYPRKAKNPFKKNTCTIGMAAGFVEPLDAPGLAITCSSIYCLNAIINDKKTIDNCNEISNKTFKKWVSFILCQYKTSNRNDTMFWDDHRNIEYAPLDELLDIIFNNRMELNELKQYANENAHELVMYFNTIAGKDIQWPTGTNMLPEKVDINSIKTIDHYKFIEGLHQIYG